MSACIPFHVCLRAELPGPHLHLSLVSWGSGPTPGSRLSFVQWNSVCLPGSGLCSQEAGIWVLWQFLTLVLRVATWCSVSPNSAWLYF